MQENDMQNFYVEHLRERGWDVTTEGPDRTDLVARRGAEQIVAEVKADTSGQGVDIDILYGRILRRMRPDRGDCDYTLVVPERLVWHAERVDQTVRERLDVIVVAVDDFGGIRTF